MKKITVSVSFDDEKLSALKMYLEQRGQSVESELEKALIRSTPRPCLRVFVSFSICVREYRQKRQKRKRSLFLLPWLIPHPTGVTAFEKPTLRY